MNFIAKIKSVNLCEQFFKSLKIKTFPPEADEPMAQKIIYLSSVARRAKDGEIRNLKLEIPTKHYFKN